MVTGPKSRLRQVPSAIHCKSPIYRPAVVNALKATNLIEKFDLDWKDFGWGAQNVVVLEPRKTEDGIKVRNFSESRKSQTISFRKQSIADALQLTGRLLSLVELPNVLSTYGTWATNSNYSSIRDAWLKNLGARSCNLGYLASYNRGFDPLKRPDTINNVLRYPLHSGSDNDGNCLTTVIAVHDTKSSYIEIGTESGRDYLRSIVEQFGKDEYEFFSCQPNDQVVD